MTLNPRKKTYRGFIYYTLRRLLHGIDQGRIVGISFRAIDSPGDGPASQIVILDGHELLHTHIAAQPMFEMLGLQQHRHAVMYFRHKLIRRRGSLAITRGSRFTRPQ